jgi:hypothetical protein
MTIMADFRSNLELMDKWIFFVEKENPGNSGRYIKEFLEHDAHAVEHAQTLFGAGRQNKKK